MKYFLGTILIAAAACGGPQSAPAGDAPLVDWQVECDTLYRLADRFGACEKAEEEVRANVRETTQIVKTNLDSIPKDQLRPEEKTQIAQECRVHANQLRGGLSELGC